MLYLIATFWLWLIAALLIGLLVGWLTVKGRSPSLVRECWPWALGLGIGALVVGLRLFPGRFGFWVDLGLLLAASYFAGCLIAYALRVAGSPEVLAPAAGAAAASAAISRADALLANAGETAAKAPAKAPAKTDLKEVAVEPSASDAANVAPPAIEEAIVGRSAPRDGKADDLTRIFGIDGPVEEKLNALGLYHFDQIAAMNPGQQRWLLARLGHADHFPSWWWRWKFDAGQIMAGKSPGEADQPLSVAAGAADETGSPEDETVTADSSASSGSGTSVKEKPAGAKSAAAAARARAGVLDADAHEGAKPQGLASARENKPDDLKRISGIGKQNEGRLHALGIWHFDQIAAWTPEEIIWVGSYLAFSGRIERENWKGQAATLAAGGVTEFAARADQGEVETSSDAADDNGQGNVATLDKPITGRPDKT